MARAITGHYRDTWDVLYGLSEVGAGTLAWIGGVSAAAVPEPVSTAGGVSLCLLGTERITYGILVLDGRNVGAASPLAQAGMDLGATGARVTGVSEQKGRAVGGMSYAMAALLLDWRSGLHIGRMPAVATGDAVIRRVPQPGAVTVCGQRVQALEDIFGAGGSPWLRYNAGLMSSVHQVYSRHGRIVEATPEFWRDAMAKMPALRNALMKAGINASALTDGASVWTSAQWGAIKQAWSYAKTGGKLPVR